MVDAAPAGRWLRAWLLTFRWLRHYFRFEVEGFEHLASGEPSLVVGYHGGPWAIDLFLLSVLVHERLGYFPPAIFLEIWGRLPVLRGMVKQLDGLYGPPTAEQMAELRARHRHLFVLPGGTREALRPFWRRHRIDWGQRTGYLKLAARHHLPLIPLVSTGLDETYIGLNEGYRLSHRLFGHGKVPLWIGIGMGGLWPLAPPWPSRIRMRIGPPIHLDRLRRPSGEEPDEEFYARAHRHVTVTLQAMLDQARRSKGVRSGRSADRATT